MVGATVSPLSVLPQALMVQQFSERERLFRRTKRVLVAVSGGADSVAALLLLQGLGEKAGFTVAAAHFDHQLRPGSGSDLEWVRDLCASLDVKCLTGEGDVRSLASERKQGIEQAARAMRYQFLAFVASKEGADCIVTGHTADDQVETVLQRILRGTGVRGVRGMLPSGPVPGAPAQRLVRPLLCLTRPDTEAVCGAAGIVPRADASNFDVSFQRNRIRHEILPLLRTLNPSLDGALHGLAESAREAFTDIERAANGLAPVDRSRDGSVFPLEAFRDLPTEARGLVVERESAFWKLSCEPNRTRLKNLEAALRARGGAVSFGEVAVEVSAGMVRVGPPPQAAAAFEPKVLNVPGVTVVGPWRITVATVPLSRDPQALDITVPSAGLSGALRARPLATGDRMLFRGRERAVADVLSNEKVPAWVRRRLVAVSDRQLVLGLAGGPSHLHAPLADDEVFYVRLLPVV